MTGKEPGGVWLGPLFPQKEHHFRHPRLCGTLPKAESVVLAVFESTRKNIQTLFLPPHRTKRSLPVTHHDLFTFMRFYIVLCVQDIVQYPSYKRASWCLIVVTSKHPASMVDLNLSALA